MAKRLHKSSKYKGVTWDKQYGQWRAQVRVGNDVRKLGRFNSEFDAALQHDLFCVAHNITGARLNFSRDELVLWAQVTAGSTAPQSETVSQADAEPAGTAPETEPVQEHTVQPAQEQPAPVDPAPEPDPAPAEPETIEQMLDRMLGQDATLPPAADSPAEGSQSTDTADP